ncbi:helix-turn-helix domain-containing protein [Nannocystis radixulma]|uniref:AraC family transcriptional regulator n=1 Tax=Nannocystis radixulma TaxID=2995305 RepID=A0ABT5B4K2_9BACT|nr:AraC family transcriptional regulator [Nannocystis radixulma]MDC0669049.1 AraC family transcriptional regulator [Nannocystis radixulma]
MYREHLAPRPLADVVDAFWTHASAAPPADRVRRILPDGCVDVIVHLVGEPRVEVVGTMTRALLVPDGASDMVAVRLRPGAARAFFDVPTDALTDARVPATALGLPAAPLLDALHRLTDPGARVRQLAAVLLAARRHPLDAMVERAVRALAGTDPPGVAELADDLGVARQSLARRVRQAVGVGPKELARVFRLQRATRALSAGRRDHAALACELGFHDQAHFIHEMRALSGLTPGAYARTISTIAADAGVAHPGAEELP